MALLDPPPPRAHARAASNLQTRVRAEKLSRPFPIVRTACEEGARAAAENTDVVVEFALRALVAASVLPRDVSEVLTDMLDKGYVKEFVDDWVEPAEVAVVVRCARWCCLGRGRGRKPTPPR